MSGKPIGEMRLLEFCERYYFDEDEHVPVTIKSRKSDIKSWQRFTDNPQLKDINHDTAAQFRKNATASDLAAHTINRTWRNVRTMLKRAAPASDANPRGMGVLFLQGLPWMRPVKGPLKKIPRRISQDELSRIYLQGVKSIDKPRHLPFPTPDFWRALLVVAYCTGLRRSDLLNLRWDEVDFANARLIRTAEKTKKRREFPLNTPAIAHLKRIRNDSHKLVFCGQLLHGGGKLGQLWTDICKAADVEPKITFQQLRQTAASEAERIRPGGGSLLLQHSQSSVTHKSYLVQLEELEEIVNQMRMPTGFTAGAGMANRKDKQRAKDAIQFRPHDFDMPLKPKRADWKFGEYGFSYRGTLFELRGHKLLLLRAFVVNDRLSTSQLAQVSKEAGYRCPEPQVSAKVGQLRTALKKMFGTPNWNPLPNLQRNASEGCWGLRVPEWVVAANNGKAVSK